jgi:hypothetical protein
MQIKVKEQGPGGSMSWVVGLPNNSYKHITNAAFFVVLTPLSAIFQLCHGDQF